MYQRRLFGSNYLPEMDEKEVQDILVDINPHLWAAIVNPFDDFLERRATDPAFRHLDEGESAQWLRPQIIYQAKQIFDSNDAMTFREHKHQKLFEYKEMIAICFKKVSLRRFKSKVPYLERSNYLTPRNRDMWQQRKVSGIPDIPRIIVGYEFFREMTDIRIVVGYPRTRLRRFKWVYAMEDQNAAVKQIADDYLVQQGDHEEDRGFVIHPRKIAKAEGTGNE